MDFDKAPYHGLGEFLKIKTIELGQSSAHDRIKGSRKYNRRKAGDDGVDVK